MLIRLKQLVGCISTWFMVHVRQFKLCKTLTGLMIKGAQYFSALLWNGNIRIKNSICLFSNMCQMWDYSLSITTPPANESGPWLLPPSFPPSGVSETRWSRGKLSFFLLLSLSPCAPLFPPPPASAAPSRSAQLLFPPRLYHGERGTAGRVSALLELHCECGYSHPDRWSLSLRLFKWRFGFGRRRRWDL